MTQEEEQAYMAMPIEKRIAFLQVQNKTEQQVAANPELSKQLTPATPFERIDTQAFNSMSIKSFLQQQGIKRINGNDAYGMYLAEWRGDKNPSLKVNYMKNRWYDFGTGKGGTIIDLVKEMHKVDFKEACKILCNGDLPKINVIAKPMEKQESKIKILSEKPVSHFALVKYAQSRGIDKATMMQYLQEINFSVEGKEKSYFGLGFKNNSGGYEIRNEFFKGCSSKDVTIIDKGLSNCNVYEGFFDFLSFESLSKRFPQHPKANAIILNSTVNLDKRIVVEFAMKHNVVSGFMDNDDTGKTAFKRLKEKLDAAFDDIEVRDCSSLYVGYKDFNEFAMNTFPISKSQKL